MPRLRRGARRASPADARGARAGPRLGERLRDQEARPDAILTSPLLRARETGDELAQAFEIEAEPDERLAPGASIEDVRAVVEGHGERVVVVGHQPDCGQIAAALTGGSELPFPAGGLAVLELD